MLCMSVRAGILTNLDVHPEHFSATEGNVVNSQIVASFTDPGESLPTLLEGVNIATNYTATITWGDGADPELGTVIANGLRGFDVIGTHTFRNHGSYVHVVQVTDIDGSSGSGSQVIKVLDAPLRPRGVPVTAAEAIEFSGVVVTFTDDNPYGTETDFSASIDWGDNTVTPADVVANLTGGFDVVGTHTYALRGSYGVTVKIADIGGVKVTAATTASVSDAPLMALGLTIHPLEGSPFAGPVATFTHADTNATADQFIASVFWGDEKLLASAANVWITKISPGNFMVSGDHTYMNEGSYAVIVDIQAVGLGGASGQAGGTAIVGDVPITPVGLPVTVTEGFPFSGAVANFVDANPNTTSDGYTATVEWGDGGASDGLVITNEAAGGFTVLGEHVYVMEGSYAITVVINDVGGAGATVGATATVLDALLTAEGTTLSPMEGKPFTSLVATFNDANSYSEPSDFIAYINWGDGNSSRGVITVVDRILGGGAFHVTGSHLYKHRGAYSITANIYEASGNYVSAGGTATVADAPLSSIARTLAPIENSSFQAVVASFTDQNPFGMSNEFTASIDWGDGIVSSGAVIANNAVETGFAEFMVLASHKYATQGRYPVNVNIQSGGGSSTLAYSMANTADAPMVGTGATINAIKSVPFTNVIATCVDTDTSPEPDTTYTCLINWGDGSTSTGMINEDSEECYSVVGSHTYAQSGSYVVIVTIDNTQTFVSTAARSTVLVSETPAEDVSSQFVIKATRPMFIKKSGLYRQTVTIRNTTRESVSGPVSIVLDNLSANGGTITMHNNDGQIVTPALAPVASPYKNVPLPKNVFHGRSTRSLYFFFDSSSSKITYSTRVLAGPGAR